MTQKSLQAVGGALTSLAALNNNFTELYARVGAIGNVFYLDAINGSDQNDGKSPANAFASWTQGYGALTSGKNDVLVIIGNGQASGSVRTSAALTWSKDACHLVGWTPPILYSQRARIAITSGATAFTPLITISGDGNSFQNVQLFHGFSTGTTSQICATITGERNYFKNMHFAGMGDQESADDAGSRSLKIGSGGAGENVFENCVIGLDTITRGAANASVEFTGATPRNSFIDCVFPFHADASSPLGYIGSAASCVDRTNEFVRCRFINAAQSGSTTLSGLGTLPASAGGLLLFKDCTLVDITEFGTDATTRGQCYVDGAAPTAADSGIAVNPT